MSTLPQTSADEAEPAASSGSAGAAIHQATVPQRLGPSHMWWKIADAAVLGVYACIVLWTIHYHEKWADEAQAWLLARDLNLYTLWFKELRYEGTPGLWHTILWIAQRVFHARYDSISYIGMAFATAGVGFMLFKAPFPRPLRWMLAFTYFMVYQYAVIARPYNLLPLFSFAAAALFKDLKHPERMTVVLVLLANLSLHGTIIAGCLGLAYLIEAIRSWAALEERVRARYVVCVGAMLVTFLFLFVILRPTPDVEEFALKKEFSQLPAAMQAQFPTALRKLTAIICGAFLDRPVPSAIFILLAAAWCFLRRRFLVFALPVGAMIALYSTLHGAAHHHGTAFVAAITALWIAWPDSEEQHRFDALQRRALQGMIALMVWLFAVNIWDASVAIHREYLYPYSGAPDAANYLKSVGADKTQMFGFLIGVAAVQAYFDHNIFANMPTTYFHHGTPRAGTKLDFDELHRVQPQYIVAYTQDPDLMYQINMPRFRAEGYEIVHFSDGYYFYKRTVFERDAYFILRRVPR